MRTLTKPTPLKLVETQVNKMDQTVVIRGSELQIDDVVRVARYGAKVALTNDAAILGRVEASRAYIESAVAENKPIYGVTSGFGGMADVVISPEEASELQSNLVWFMNVGAGNKIPQVDVRATMLVRANSHLHGASGLRLALIQRLVTFLNADMTPHVFEFSSIGASGDLAPMAQITGALIGLDRCFKVDHAGEEIDALTALERLGLPRLQLRAKEGLAMMDGTSAMTGIAANCIQEAQQLLALTLGAHALMIQGLAGTNQSFHPFIGR